MIVLIKVNWQESWDVQGKQFIIVKKDWKIPNLEKNIVRSSKLDPYKEIIDTKVDKYHSKAMNVYKFIKKQGYTGGYGIVRNYVKSHKNEQIKKAIKKWQNRKRNFESKKGIKYEIT